MAVYHKMLCAIFFEIFLCLPFLLSALLVFTLRSHDPDSENSAARVYDKLVTLFYLAYCEKLILLLNS